MFQRLFPLIAFISLTACQNQPIPNQAPQNLMQAQAFIPPDQLPTPKPTANPCRFGAQAFIPPDQLPAPKPPTKPCGCRNMGTQAALPCN